MNINCGIYLITNLTNGKVYIGSSKNLKKRKYAHWWELRKGGHTNPHLQSAYNLDGEQNFQWEVLMNCDEEDLLYWEDYFMSFFASREDKCGYNLYSADRREVSEKTRAKLSENNGRYWLGKKLTESHRENVSAGSRSGTPEVRAKLAVANKGKPGPNTGRIFSEGWRINISISQMGRKQSPETIEKRIAPLRGRKQSKEVIARKSASMMGHSVSEETKRKLSKASSKNWIVMRPDGTEEMITNLYRFCRENGLDASTMGRVAKGKQKHHKGWRCSLI